MQIGHLEKRAIARQQNRPPTVGSLVSGNITNQCPACGGQMREPTLKEALYAIWSFCQTESEQTVREMVICERCGDYALFAFD
jgi:hypothetical protein